MLEKIKQFLETEKGQNILIILIIILVGVISFTLGRLSTQKKLKPGIEIKYLEY